MPITTNVQRTWSACVAIRSLSRRTVPIQWDGTVLYYYYIMPSSFFDWEAWQQTNQTSRTRKKKKNGRFSSILLIKYEPITKCGVTKTDRVEWANLSFDLRNKPLFSSLSLSLLTVTTQLHLPSLLFSLLRTFFLFLWCVWIADGACHRVVVFHPRRSSLFFRPQILVLRSKHQNETGELSQGKESRGASRVGRPGHTSTNS